jgi:DNA-nicking Smr family endonuclease
MDEFDPVELPIDGILDLHLFSPKEIGDLIPDYIEACRERKIYRIRIIHGKGTGSLRATVHSILEKHPDVISYETAKDASSWGATIAYLKPSEP